MQGSVPCRLLTRPSTPPLSQPNSRAAISLRNLVSAGVHHPKPKPKPKPNPILRMGSQTTTTPLATRFHANGSPLAASSSSVESVSARIGEVERVTKETHVSVKINLDGTGIADSSTGIPFLDHMLDQLSSHGLFDIHVKSNGDIHIDDHHTNEDVALAIGTALLQALGDRKGIKRFGDFSAPLDEALIHVSLLGGGGGGFTVTRKEMAVVLAPKLAPTTINATFKLDNQYKKRQPKCSNVILSSSSRRHLLASSASFVTLNCFLTPLKVWAEDDKSTDNQEEEKDEGIMGVLKSFFDPNEKTKSGKLLPKGYLKSAREVVKNLRESLKEDPVDIVKFRRTADAAKESIREYLSNWRGQEMVVQEESYVQLEKAIRSLASFYSKAGPSAPLPEEVKSEMLNDLNAVEEFL